MITRIAESVGGNRIVLALSVARLADALGNSILFILIPLYVARLPAPQFPFPESVLVGLLISLYGIVTAIAQPIMGALSDRMGRRKPFIQAGLLVIAAGTLAFVMAQRFTDLLLIRSFQGLGVALTVSASVGLMATATEKRTRGGSMGIYTALRLVGFAVGPLIGGSLHVLFGFNAAFYAGAAFIVLSMTLVHLWLPDVRVARSPYPARPAGIIGRELFTSGIVGLGVATFTMAAAFSMMVTLQNEFNERLNQTALAFSVAFSALMVSRLLLQVPLGRLSDRIGRKPLIVAGLILMGPATALLGESGTTLQLIGIRLLQGVASAAIAAPTFALAADLTSAGSEAQQMSIITMGFGLGTALGPLIAGILAVVFFELPFFIGGLMALIGAWVVYQYVPESVHREQAQATRRVQESRHVECD